jgi:hypothetical protein
MASTEAQEIKEKVRSKREVRLLQSTFIKSLRQDVSKRSVVKHIQGKQRFGNVLVDKLIVNGLRLSCICREFAEHIAAEPEKGRHLRVEMLEI